MRQSIIPIIVFSILALSTTSCTSTKAENVVDAKEEAKRANQKLEEANIAYENELAVYREEIQNKIAENQLLVVKLKEEKLGESKAYRADREARITELEKRNRDLEWKMKNYKGKTRETLDDFKKEMKHDMNSLAQAFKELGSNDVPN